MIVFTNDGSEIGMPSAAAVGVVSSLVPSRGVPLSSSASCHRADQRTHPNEVVDRGGEEELPPDSRSSAMAGPSHEPDGLHPTERFFDQFPHPLTDRIAPVARRASV